MAAGAALAGHGHGQHAGGAGAVLGDAIKKKKEKKNKGRLQKKNGKGNDIGHFSVRPPYPKDIVT